MPEIQVSTVDIEEYREKQEEFVNFWINYVDRVRVYEEHSSDGHLGSIKGDESGVISRQPCNKVYEDMIIYWNGDVALCNHDWDNKLSIGNVGEKTIKEIWCGDEYTLVRKMHENCNFDEKIVCAHCDHWKIYYTEEGYLGRAYTKSIEGDK